MTAIVGILNRQGIAFAADSAATLTVSSTHKITNHANKIFELSKIEPIGIAMYGNMNLMKLSWEQIIKMYRKKLADTKFDSLEEYAADFFTYVRNLMAPNQDNIYTQNQIRFLVNSFYDEIIKLANDKLKEKSKELSDENIVVTMMDVMKSISDSYKQKDTCLDCKNLTLESFTDTCDEYVSSKLAQCLSVKNCPVNFKETFIETLYFIVRSTTHVYASSTGLVFFGYGDKELMPSYHSYTISELFEDKLKIVKNGDYVVDGNNGA